MDLLREYENAVHDAEIARLRRVLAIRAMLLDGQSQREIAQQLGLTQPAISYQAARERTDGVRPSDLISAGRSVLLQMAEQRGFTELAAFGSSARGDDRVDSDVDLLVQPREGADLFEMHRLEEDLAAVLGRDVDVVSYRGLDPVLDKDILHDRVTL